MDTKIRLYFSGKIQSDLVAQLSKEQSHYLKDVMRLKVGDSFSVFNIQGEWNANVHTYEKEGAQIKIFSIEGKLMFSNLMTEENEWIDISNVESGVYMLKISYKEYEKTLSFIKR